MNRICTKVTLLLTVLMLLFTMGAVSAAAEDVVAPSEIGLYRGDGYGDVFYTNGSNSAALVYRISNYNELADYFGCTPEWSVEFPEGGEEYFALNNYGSSYEVMYCYASTEPRTVPLQVSCVFGDLSATAEACITFREHPDGVPEEFNIPRVIDLPYGESVTLDLYGTEPEGWLEEGVTIYWNCHPMDDGTVESEAVDLDTFTLSSTQPGIHRMYANAIVSTMHVTNYFVVRVAEEDGTVPQLPLTIDNTAGGPVTLYAGGGRDWLNVGGFAPADLEIQRCLKAGEPVWSVTCTGGDESLFHVNTQPNFMDFTLCQTASQPQTVTFDVSCTWDGETVSETFTVEIVETDFAQPVCQLPDELILEMGEERSITIEEAFAPAYDVPGEGTPSFWAERRDYDRLHTRSDGETVTITAISDGICQVDFYWEYANLRARKSVLVYIKDAEGNLPSFPEADYTVTQHYDTLYTGGSLWPDLTTLSLNNWDTLFNNYGYNNWEISLTGTDSDLFGLELQGDTLRMTSQPSAAGTLTATVELFLDHNADLLDQVITRELTFQVVQTPQELLAGEFTPAPLYVPLGETVQIPNEAFLPENSGIKAEDIWTSSYSQPSCGGLRIDETGHFCIEGLRSGAFRGFFEWQCANLECRIYLPLLISNSDGTWPEIPQITLTADRVCDLVFTQYYSSADLVTFYITNLDEMVEYYGEHPHWEYRIEGTDENFIYGEWSSQRCYFRLNGLPQTPGEVTIIATCVLGSQSLSASHTITVSDQGRDDFCGVDLPSYLTVQPGQNFSLDAMTMLRDESWSLPLGAPVVTIRGNQNIYDMGREGTVSTWMTDQSGVHNATLYWHWGNYYNSRSIAIIVADENGVYPVVEPEFNTAQYCPSLYANGNFLTGIIGVNLSNYSTLNAYYGIDSVTWSLETTESCGAELILSNTSDNYVEVRLNTHPTMAGTLTGRVRADIDYADDSQNTTIYSPFTIEVTDPGVDFPEGVLQSEDLILSLGESATVDYWSLLPGEEFPDLQSFTYGGPSVDSAVYVEDYWIGRALLHAQESGVYRLTQNIMRNNVIFRLATDVYILNDDGSMPVKPVFSLEPVAHATTVYTNGSSGMDLVTFSVPDATAVCRYYNSSISWDVKRENDLFGVLDWYYTNEDDDQNLVLWLWSTPQDQRDIQVHVSATCDGIVSDCDVTIHCVDLGAYGRGSTYFCGPFDSQPGETMELFATDILPPGVDISSGAMNIWQTDGTDAALLTYADGLVTLEVLQPGLNKVSFGWQAANASGSGCIIVRSMDESGVLPELPVFDLSMEVLSSECYIGGTTGANLIACTIENAAELFDLYGAYPTWEVSFENGLTSAGNEILTSASSGEWNETLYIQTWFSPDQEQDITVTVTGSMGPNTATRQYTLSTKEPGVLPHRNYATTPMRVQMNELFTLNINDVMPEGIDPAAHENVRIEVYNNAYVADFSRDGEVLSFIPRCDGVRSLVLCIDVANLTFYSRVVMLVANESGEYPQIPEFTVEKTPLEDTLYCGGDYPLDLARYFVPGMQQLYPAYGYPEWRITADDGSSCIQYYTFDSYSAGMAPYVWQAPQKSGVLRLNVHCELAGQIYTDVIELNVLENPGIDSGTSRDCGEIDTQIGQTVTIPLAELLPEGVDPAMDGFILTQTSGTAFAEMTSYENGEAVFAIHQSGVIGMRLRWNIRNLYGYVMVTFNAADSEGNAPVVPEFYVTEEVVSPVIYRGGTDYGADLIVYTLQNADAFYAMNGSEPSWGVEEENDSNCNTTWNIEGTYGERLIIRLCCQPWELADIGFKVTCSDLEERNEFSRTISIVEGPSVSSDATMEYADILLPLNEDTVIDMSTLLPEGIDPTLCRTDFRLNDHPSVTVKECAGTTLTLNATVPGFARGNFYWTSGGYCGYSSVLFRVADESGVYPADPEFSVDERSLCDTIYVGGNDFADIAEFTVPDASGLVTLNGANISWNVTFQNDPYNVLQYDISGEFSESLRIRTINHPGETGEITALIECTDGTSTFQTTMTVTVAGGPESMPPFNSLQGPIQAQLGQTFTIDPYAICDGWTLPTGAPFVNLNNNDPDLFELVSTDGGVNTWRPTEAGAYNVYYSWNWANYGYNSSVVFMVADENGNMPLLEPDCYSGINTPTLYTNGNNRCEIANVFMNNFDAYDSLYNITSTDFDVQLETDTGLTVSTSEWEQNVSIYVKDHPTQTGKATLTVTMHINTEDPSACATIVRTMEITVEAYDGVVPPRVYTIDTVTAAVGDTFRINKDDVLPDGFGIDRDRIIFYYPSCSGLSLIEYYDDYAVYCVDAEGINSIIYDWYCANFTGQGCIEVLVPDASGETPAIPEFRVTRTMENNVTSIHGDSPNITLFTYTLDNAGELARLNGGNPFFYNVSHNGNGFISSATSGTSNETLRVYVYSYPTETGEVTIDVTCSAGPYEQTFTETVCVVEGPVSAPTDLAAAKVLQAQIGQTFSIDASDLADSWTLGAGDASLRLISYEDKFEYVGREGSVHTWRALESGLFSLSFEWNWGSHHGIFERIISVADESGVYPSTEPEFVTDFLHDTLYVNGNLLTEIARLRLGNYETLQSLKNYHNVYWSMEGTGGVYLPVVTTSGETEFIIRLDDRPTEAGTATFIARCHLDSWNDENDAVYEFPLTFNIVEQPDDLKEITGDAYMPEYIYVPLNSSFDLDTMNFIPPQLRTYSDANGWIANHDYRVEQTAENGSIRTFTGVNPGVAIINGTWFAGNLTGDVRQIVVVGNEDGTWPYVPVLELETEILTDTYYIGGNTIAVPLATFTFRGIETLNEMYGGHGMNWSVTYEGDSDMEVRHSYIGGPDAVLTLKPDSFPTTTGVVTATVTGIFGNRRVSSTVDILVANGPETEPDTLAGDTPLFTQIGQTFSIDAAQVANGWSLPTGTPTLTMTNAEGKFELVSVEGSVHTWRALETGAFTAEFDWQWNSYKMWPSLSIIVTDEGGSITPADPAFVSLVCNKDQDDTRGNLYTGGNLATTIAEAWLDNPEALYIDSVTWQLESITGTDMTVELQYYDEQSYYCWLTVAKQPTQAGEATVVYSCTIDSFIDELDNVYTFEVPLTIHENPISDLDEAFYMRDLLLPYGAQGLVEVNDAIPDALGTDVLTYCNGYEDYYSANLTLESNDGYIQYWSAKKPGAYRIEYSWDVANLCGTSYVNVLAVDENGVWPELPTTDVTVVTYDSGIVYTGGNLSSSIVEFIVEDYHRLYDYWGEYPEVTVDCNFGTNDAIGYTTFNDPYTVAFVGNNVPVAETLTQRVTVGMPGQESTVYSADIVVTDAPANAPRSIDEQVVIAEGPGAAFTLTAGELLGGWTLPTAQSRMNIMNINYVPVSQENGSFTWLAPDAPGVYHVDAELVMANYLYNFPLTVIVPDESGAVPAPEFSFLNTIICGNLYIGGNHTYQSVGYTGIDPDDLTMLKSTYGYEQIGWELADVTGSDATFYMSVIDDYGFVVLRDHPTVTGEITITVNCILDSKTDALDFVIPTTLTVTATEWTGGDFTVPGDLGTPTYAVGEAFALDLQPALPQGVENIDEIYYDVPNPDAVHTTDWDGRYLYMNATQPGTFPLDIQWVMDNISGTIHAELHILDENGSLPPEWSVSESRAFDNTLYIGGTHGVDLVTLKLENAQALSEYAGEIVWNVEFEGDPDYILRGYTSGDYNENYLLTTEMVCQTPSQITARITCTAGTMGTIFDRSYPVVVTQGPDSAPQINMDDPLVTQLGQTFTIDAAAAIAGDWSLPTGQPFFICDSDKLELVSFNGSSYTFRALEAGNFKASFHWRWSTYYQHKYIDLLVYNEDGTLPLIEPDIQKVDWVDAVYVGGNMLRNTHSLFTQNLDVLQQIYGYAEPQWSITSTTGYEEYFTVENYAPDSCGLSLAKQPEAAASFELELTGVYDSADDQYDQTVKVIVPVTFAEIEGLPEIPEEKEMPLIETRTTCDFSFTWEDILPDGFSLPTGKPEFWLFDHFDMHEQRYSEEGTFLFTAKEAGLFKLGVAWQWENFSGWTNVNLYVSSSEAVIGFYVDSNHSVNRTVYTNGNHPDVQNFWLCYDELYAGTPVWTFRHIDGPDLGYTLEVEENGMRASLSTSSLPTGKGMSIYELTCTWNGSTETIVMHLSTETLELPPVRLDLPAEVTVTVGESDDLFFAENAVNEAGEYVFVDDSQSVSLDREYEGLACFVDFDRLIYNGLKAGVYKFRLTWQCSNFTLYHDLVIKVLNEDGSLPSMMELERIDVAETLYTNGNMPEAVRAAFYVNNFADITASTGCTAIQWALTSQSGYEDYFTLNSQADQAQLVLAKQPDFVGSFVLEITATLDAADDAFDETLTLSVPVTFATAESVPAFEQTLGRLSTQEGQPVNIFYDVILPGGWSLPTDQPRYYQAGLSEEFEQIGGNEYSMTFLAHKPGSYYVPMQWEWSNFTGMTYVGVYVSPLNNASFEVISDEGNSRGIFLEGNVPDSQTFRFAGDAAGVKPEWTLRHMFGPDLGYTGTASEDGMRFTISAPTIPTEENTSILEIVCEWNGETYVYTQRIHVVPCAFTVPTAIDLPDTIKTRVGESITLEPRVLPEAWPEEGIEQTLSHVGDTGGMTVTATNGNLIVEPTEAGIKKLTVRWQSGNIALTKEITLRISTADGMMPPEGMLLSYANDETNYYFIHDEAYPEFKTVWLSNFDEIQSFYGGLPTWSLTVLSGTQELALTEGEYGNYPGITMPAVPTEEGTTTYRIDCTWGDLSCSKEFTLHVIDAYVPTEQTLPTMYKMHVGDTLTITLDDVMGDERFDNHGAEEGFTFFSFDAELDACFDKVSNADGSFTITAKTPASGSFLVNWSCGNVTIVNSVYLLVVEEGAEFPDLTMIVKPDTAAMETYYVGGTSTDVCYFNTVNYNDLFPMFGSEATWTLTQLSGTTQLQHNNSSFASASGFRVYLPSILTEPETITYQVSCDWNGYTSYQSEVFTINVVNPETPLPTTIPADPVYYAEVGETVTLSVDALTPEGWAQTGNDTSLVLFSIGSSFGNATETASLENGDVSITALTPGLHKFQVSWTCGNLFVGKVCYFAIPDESGVIDGLSAEGFCNHDEISTYYIGGNSDEISGFFVTNTDELKRIFGSDFSPEWSFEITSGADLAELCSDVTDDEFGFYVLLKEPLTKTGTLTYTVTCSALGRVLRTWNMTVNITEATGGLPAEIITPEKIIIDIGDTLTFGPTTVIPEGWTAPEGAMVFGGVSDGSPMDGAFDFGYETDGTGHYKALTPGIYEISLYWTMGNHSLYKDVCIYVRYEDGTVPIPGLHFWADYGDTTKLYLGGNHNLANVFIIDDFLSLSQKYDGMPEWTVTQLSGEPVDAYVVPWDADGELNEMFLRQLPTQPGTVELRIEVRWGDAVGTFDQTITFVERDFNLPIGFVVPYVIEVEAGGLLDLPECPVYTEGLDYDDWGFGRTYTPWFNENFTYDSWSDGYEHYRAKASGATAITVSWRYRNYVVAKEVLIIVLNEDGTSPLPELATTLTQEQTTFLTGGNAAKIASVSIADEVYEAYSEHLSSQPVFSAEASGSHEVQVVTWENGRGADIFFSEPPTVPGKTAIDVTTVWQGMELHDAITVTVEEAPGVAIRAESFQMLQGMTYIVDLTGDVTGLTTAFESSDEDVVTINEAGEMTAVAPGKAKVILTVTTASGATMVLDAPVTVLEDMVSTALPMALKTIEEEAFWASARGCVFLPYGVTSIGERAFAQSPSLRFLLIPATVTDIAPTTLDGSDNAIVLCDPGSAAEAFAVAQGIPYYFLK